MSTISGNAHSVVASKVDLVGFLQCKQFVVKFALQCGCRVSFKYFVGLFVINKRVHFVVVVSLVHNNSHLSLVCGQYDYVLVCFQSFISAFCSSEVKLLFGSIIPSTDVIQLTLTLKITTYSGLRSRGRSNSTYFLNK